MKIKKKFHFLNESLCGGTSAALASAKVRDTKPAPTKGPAPVQPHTPVLRGLFLIGEVWTSPQPGLPFCVHTELSIQNAIWPGQH